MARWLTSGAVLGMFVLVGPAAGETFEQRRKAFEHLGTVGADVSITAHEQATLKDVLGKLAPAVGLVRVKGENGVLKFGTAFAVSAKRRLFVTNLHVVSSVNGKTAITVSFPKSRTPYTITRITTHRRAADLADLRAVLKQPFPPLYEALPELDLALLEAGDGPLPTHVCTLATPAEAKESPAHAVVSLGYGVPPGQRVTPEAQRPVYGFVRHLRPFTQQATGDVLWHTLPNHPGSSGSPLVNTAGRVLGVNFASTRLDDVRANRHACAVRIDVLWELLDAHDLSSAVADTRTETGKD